MTLVYNNLSISAGCSPCHPQTPPEMATWIIQQGATTRLPVYLKANGAPVDLTGYDARLQVRTAYADDSGVLLLDLSVTAGNIIITPIQGKLELVVQPSDTLNTTWTRGIFDLEIIAPNGDVTNIWQGIAFLKKEVTR